MSLRQCKVDGCFAIVPSEVGYCDRHRHVGAERAARDAAGATARWDAHHARTGDGWVYKDARWKRLRANHLRLNPQCISCGEKATTVDHVKPHRGDTGLAFDPWNLQSMCGACHARKSRGDRP